jgi:hypothetical protein
VGQIPGAVDSEAAKVEVDGARLVVASWPVSVRIAQALAKEKRVQQTIADNAAKRNCARNCRQLLQQQLEQARAEVADARSQDQKAQGYAKQALADAEQRLKSLPIPASTSPLADRLGLPPWSIDLATAALASLAANGLAAFLIAFSVHGTRREQVRVVQAADVEIADAEELPAPVKRIAKPRKKADRKPKRTAEREAISFADDLLRPNPNGRVCPNDLEEAYRGWCQRNGVDPLPNAVIAPALGELFDEAGLEVSSEAIIGIDLKEPLRLN